MALAFVMALRLLVYRLAALRVCQRVVASAQTVPDQLRQPAARPTAQAALRWLFPYFEGIDLCDLSLPDGTRMWSGQAVMEAGFVASKRLQHSRPATREQRHIP